MLQKVGEKVNEKEKRVIDNFKTAQTFFSAKRLYEINIHYQ